MNATQRALKPTAATSDAERADWTPRSAKIAEGDRAHLNDIANDRNLNLIVVIRAMRLAFDKLGEERQRYYLRRARTLYPYRHVRRGRGNRLRSAG